MSHSTRKDGPGWRSTSTTCSWDSDPERPSVELSRLGGRGDGPSARGRRGGARACGPEQGRGGLRPLGPVRAPASADGRLGLCHSGDVTRSITIAYSCSCNRFPSSYPSFAIRRPRALKTLCGRLEIVDRRDDHALISAAGHHRHPRRCHRTTIARRPATRTRGWPTEAP